MAGLRRMRRRYRSIPVFVVLLVFLTVGLTSSSANTADPSTASVANDVSAGLQTFAQSLTGLAGLNQLGQSLPFTAVRPDDATGLDFAHTFTDSLKSQLAAHGPTFTSLDNLRDFLNTGIDGTYDGVAIDAGGTVGELPGGIYSIGLTLDLSRSATTPLKLDTAAVNVDGGSLTTAFHTTANLTFKYDPAQAAGNKLYLDAASSPTLSTTASASAAPLSSFDVNLGFTQVHVTGSADIGATINAQLQDPDGNGKISQTEWETTAPQQTFDVGFTASHANANLSLASDIPSTLGGGLTSATITEADANLANGLDAPTVDLGQLGAFKNIQPGDFLSGLASFAIMIQSLESSGPAGTAIPFLQHDPHADPSTANGRPVEHLGDFLKLNESLIHFFTVNGLNNTTPGSDPLSLNLSTADLASVATIQQVTGQLASALGMAPGTIGLAYNPTTHKLTFTLGQSKTLAPITGRVDIADQLQNIGITGVQAAAQATITPSYTWSAKLGLDLSSSSTPLNQRFFVVPNDTHFSAEFPVTGTLDLAGQIGFLGVSLKSGHAGTDGVVDLLAARNTGKPMLNLQLKNKAHPGEDLSFSDVFAAYGSSSALANPLDVLDASDASDVFNAKVPSFDLKAQASLGDTGPNVLSGLVTVGWDKVTDPSTLSMSANGNFNDQLLNFDFDSSNPQAMFTTIMNVLGPFADQLSQLVASNPNLQAKLPVINRSFADLVTEFDKLKQQIQDFATSPASYLQFFEQELQIRIADVLKQVSGVTLSAADQQKLVNITAPPPASPGDPQVIMFHLSFGVCGQAAGSTAPAGCSVTYPLNVPLNVDLPSLGGVVGVGSTGSIGIDASAIVNLSFGIQLPHVSALPGGLPTASGSPVLFIDTAPADTSLHLDVSAQTSDNTTLEANVGPLKVKIGKGVAPETGAQCSNATDDDGDGVVNDGCPAVGAPENVATGQCNNATDDDSPPDGAINDGCPATGAPIEARIGAKFHLEHDTGGDHRLVVDPTNLSNITSWLGDTVPASLDDFRPATKVSCAGLPGSFGAGPFDACASLPVFVGNSATSPPDGYITFAAPNLFDTGTYKSNVDPGIVSAIEAEALDFTTWINGLNELSTHLSAMLDTASYQNANIPVIGNSLSAGAKIAKAFHDGVTQPLSDVATALHGLDPADVKTQVQNALYTPLLDAGILLPFDSTADPASATASDIHVQVLCGGDEHVCVPGDHAVDISDVSVGVAIGQVSHDELVKFQGGLPGLRLTMDDPLTSSVGWRLDLNFGLSKTRGFYVRTDDPMPGRTKGELTVDASLHLPQHVEGDIAFLRLKMANNHDVGTPDMSIGLAADLKGGQADAQDGGAVKLDYQSFTASDPQNPADVAVKLDANIDLNLHLTTTIHLPDSLGIPDNNNASGPQLPELSTNFLLTWDFGAGFSLNNGVDASSGATPLKIQFNDVSLDLGQFFGNFLGPIVKEVQRFTKPLQPVLDTVNAPIPGISDLSELAGAGPVTMIDYFEHASGADLTLVKRLIKLVDLINALPTSGSSIVLGSFTVSGSGAEGPTPTGDNADSLIDTKSPAFSDSTNVLDQANSEHPFGNGSAFADASSGDGGLTFPAFQHPTTLFSLLVGKDVKLIEFDAGNLSATFSFDITIGPFPVGPVPVSIIVGGSAGVSGHFAIGYSTRGIREAVKNLTDDTADHSVFEVGSLLFDGVFIDDLNADGVDVPEIELTAEVHAGAEVDIVIASAGVEAGIRATVDLNLHDGGRPTVPSQVDGLLYIDEIAKMLNNPICLFDVSGQLDAFVKFFIDVGISPFDVSFDVTLVDVTLLKMDDITGPICDHPPPPHLAEVHGTTLVLKMGPYTPGRNINDGNIGDLVTNEKFVVRQLDSNPGAAHSYSVTAFGLTQTFDGIERIFADGGAGDDSIMMQPGATPSASAPTANTPAGTITTDTYDVTAPIEICGGPGNDNIQGGRGADTISGDSSETSGPTGGFSVDTGLPGAPGSLQCAVNTSNTGAGDGTDKIDGGSGDDHIYGNGGVDSLNAGDGNDYVAGGDGTDSIQGGPGADELHGNGDADSVEGGPEVDPTSTANVHNCNLSLPTCVTDAQVKDTIYGEGGNDTLTGDGGSDTVYGGDGNDTISGGSGNDILNGDANDDTITGGTGDDTANGGSGADKIFGEAGSDTLNGGDGPDVLIGSDDNTASTGVGDTLNGDGGNDLIFGDQAVPQGGTFVETGSFVGNDTINGGSENDVVYGQNGADTISGGTGDDELHGENGNDTMNGDAGIDTMFGDAGIDTMHGGSEADVMRGGSEHDVMFGDGGDDTMFGDSGDDTMNGNDGVDHMRGGTENDTMHGDAQGDVMNGDAGTDHMYGDGGNDVMHGDAGDDYMEGNADTDTMTGDAGQDDMIGGSSVAGSADAGDTMCGGDCITPALTDDHDVMVGDNGTIARPGGDRVDGAHVRTVVLFDLASADTSLYGNDTMSGDQGNDRIFGGGGNDTLHGNSGDDALEGNSGSDAIFGDEGQDDLIGGTSQSGGAADGGGTPDGNDCIQGDNRDNNCGTSGSGGGSAAGGTGGGSAGGDVMIGDNGSIARSVNAAGTDWVRDDFGFGADGIARRTVTLYDVGTTTYTPPAGTSGDDYLYGDGERDVQYGQGGNDVIHGGAGDDYAEGNAGGDQIFGENGNDDLIGGSKDALRLDTGDVISGGQGYDVIAGDNAVLARVLVSGHWVKNTYDDGISHVGRVLQDIDSASSAIVSGNDTITGGSENDLIYGQGGVDTIQGNENDDFIEGNAAGDIINGNEGQDDIVGGTVQAGVSDGADQIHGDQGADVVAGDNATITRPLDASSLWIHDNRSHTASDIVRRNVTLYDVATTTSTPAAGSSDGDTITGDDGADQLFGQGGNDTVSGGGDDDYVEGNAGDDTLNGNLGRDDVIGGGSANDGVISATSVGNGLLDGSDTIHGNESGDAIAGDNARITRGPAAPPATAATLWQTDPNTEVDAAGDRDPVRFIQQFDLDKVGAATPAATTSGGDNLSGDDGRDVMVGQGGDDTMSGGDGVDYMNGNTGADTMTGDAGEDDMVGGSSSGNGLVTDVLPAVQRGTYSSPRDLRDSGDTMSGNLEDDAMAGDNASIARPERVSGSGLWWRLTNSGFDLARRIVTMEQTPEAAGAYGNDTMNGNDGNDDMYGQLGNDTMSGNEGEDAMVGDLGQITNNLIGADDGLPDPGNQQVIAPSAPFFDPGETIFATGSLNRKVELYAFDSLLPNVGAGNDTMFGGDGHDSMHGGPGADVMDGNTGDDYMFAGDSTLVTFPLATYSPAGADAMWGGPGHDTMYGGHGVDYIDVLPRPSFVDKKGTFPKDPQAWFDAVLTDAVQPDGHAGAYSGSDIMYGGWDQDWMQLDISGPGPPPGDRAVDWNGGFNAYYRCDPSYGDWGITRQHSPSMQTFLQQLAFGMGAVQTTTPGTSGYDEVAMVFPGDPNNANPVNPDNPAHFTCGVPHS